MMLSLPRQSKKSNSDLIVIFSEKKYDLSNKNIYKKTKVINLFSRKKSIVSKKKKLNVSQCSENDDDFVSQPSVEPSPSKKFLLTFINPSGTVSNIYSILKDSQKENH